MLIFQERLCGILATLAVLVTANLHGAEPVIDFNRDIRPILSDNCYACHGPDEQERQGGDGDAGGLRLDTKEGAFSALDDERYAIVAGDVERSELVRRIWADEGEVMPPADHRKRLSREQKEMLTHWVQQGAEWSQHWSYVPPRRHPTPHVQHTDAVHNWIDPFILRRLEAEGIEPSPPANPRTLVRRLFFDITGLPPQPRDVEAYLNDADDNAWERLVDQLLDSPHYGERMAIYWLDLVRYADTVGYHGDQPVSVSPYRDYVIDAFNSNMPFDEFTREQLAGDLLADPTREQLIASGYNRLGMMSAEGGVQDKEYLAKYAADRVRTASSVWLGSTLACAECHDHKFDPFTTRDFYRFAAFFADIKERGLYAGAHADGRWGPEIEIVDERLPELLKPIDARLVELRADYEQETPEILAAREAWEAQIREKKAGPEKVPDKIQTIVEVEAAKRSDDQRKQLAEHYRGIDPSLAPLRKELTALQKERDHLVAALTRSTLITEAVEPRTMRVLPRGNWMDDSGEVVQPGVPEFLKQLERDERGTRLDLSTWLVDPDNPLTARVMVNRLWKLFFGTGISKVLDDIGAQGEPPVHPELLDSLAVEFVESGWDVKHLVKLMVMSGTYRQSSLMPNELKQRDPFNRLLARQSRYRFDAELVRDNALAVSGLLIRRLGGRSAKPYQPEGLYQHLNFPKRTYEADRDENQYRRGLYTHWQRQFLHPAMKSFDAPSREECTADRPRSNTPLAALVMLNDPSYVEAARAFAERALRERLDSAHARVNWMITNALGRPAAEAEVDVLMRLLDLQREHFESNPNSVKEFTAIGLLPVARDLDAAEVAGWTAVARAIFNMHEFITRN